MTERDLSAWDRQTLHEALIVGLALKKVPIMFEAGKETVEFVDMRGGV